MATDTTNGRKRIMATYYGYRGDFSNRFTVAAFATKGDRDLWLAEAKGSEQARPITRKDARKALADGMLSPGDHDYRESIGCYVGSRDDYRDDERARGACDVICIPAGFSEDNFPEYLHLDVANPPVRL